MTKEPIKITAEFAPNLPERLRVEKTRKKCEGERDQAWREYDEAAKEIERHKDALIEDIERRLGQDVTEQTLFRVNWRVA